jgi:hypothetical protein
MIGDQVMAVSRGNAVLLCSKTHRVLILAKRVSESDCLHGATSSHRFTHALKLTITYFSGSERSSLGGTANGTANGASSSLEGCFRMGHQKYQIPR